MTHSKDKKKEEWLSWVSKLFRSIMGISPGDFSVVNSWWSRFMNSSMIAKAVCLDFGIWNGFMESYLHMHVHTYCTSTSCICSWDWGLWRRSWLAHMGKRELMLQIWFHVEPATHLKQRSHGTGFQLPFLLQDAWSNATIASIIAPL